MGNKNTTKWLLGLGAGFAAGYTLYQQIYAQRLLQAASVPRSLSLHQENQLQFPYLGSRQEIESCETDTYTMTHTIEDGIERIVYVPKQRRFETPILMQHGMWHGAWVWQGWQELFAAWGWESHAHSLPGHGNSPEQRPIWRCTLDYYLAFFKAEIDRLPVKPVLMGHSMGGALSQWYFRYVDDELPAAVLLAPWVSHSVMADGMLLFLKTDPVGVFRIMTDWSATPLVRSPQSAASLLLGKDAAVTPEWLQERLGPESSLVMMQHNPPHWYPPDEVHTPILWVAAEKDAAISLDGARRSAAHYQADLMVVENAGHNIMHERRQAEVAEAIQQWLSHQSIP